MKSVLRSYLFLLVYMNHTVSCTHIGRDKRGLPRYIFYRACEQALHSEDGKVFVERSEPFRVK